MGLLGIELKFECPACGNILTQRHPFWTKKLRENLPEPERCGCGRRRGFTIIDFKRCDYDVVKNESDDVDGRPASPSNDVFDE